MLGHSSTVNSRGARIDHRDHLLQPRRLRSDDRAVRAIAEVELRRSDATPRVVGFAL